jgi:hypothetical protein
VIVGEFAKVIIGPLVESVAFASPKSSTLGARVMS